MGKAQDILHQTCHALGFPVYLSRKGDDILLLHHVVLKQLRIAGNGVQGRFQLMGHIGGEFTAHLLRLFLFGHIEKAKSDTGNFSFRHNWAGADLVLPGFKAYGLHFALPLQCQR